MNIVHIVIIVLLLVLVFLALRPQMPSKKVTFMDEGYDPDWGLQWRWPVTWNFDWGGGPGYDRHQILTERGPYNPGGHRGESHRRG